MDDLTAKRTLVKSPPELWTELSEADGLARHLGELGDIRITKVEPEKTVAWEGEHASGTVEIEASGWGTKVTLTAAVTERAPREPQSMAEPPADVEPVAKADSQPAPSAEAEAAIAQEERATEPTPAGDAEATVSEPEPAAEAAATATEAEAPMAPWLSDPAPPLPVSESRPEPAAARWEPPRTAPPPARERRGFLSRLLGRRSRSKAAAVRAPGPTSVKRQPPRAWQEPAWHTQTQPAPEPAPPPPPPKTEGKPTAVGPGANPEVTAEPGPARLPVATPEPLQAHPKPASSVVVPRGEPAPQSPQVEDAEPRTEPALDHGKVLAVLEGALDSLGSAHHRPFSRG